MDDYHRIMCLTCVLWVSGDDTRSCHGLRHCATSLLFSNPELPLFPFVLSITTFSWKHSFLSRIT